jgi:peptidoglycan L-alanyl-D-glutamate endopeptidase CwlK
MINSRDLNDLHPKVKAMAEKFLAKCKEHGLDILVTSTYRDNESQNALYAQGRTTAGKKVTNAKGGQSWHNYKLALDFVPIVNGKAQWADTAAFTKAGHIAKEVGFEWAGDWVKFKELAHIQFTNGLTLKDLQAGKTIDG